VSSVNVLVTSSGRRVELVHAIRAELVRLGGGSVVTADAGLSAAGHVSDAHVRLPRVDRPEFPAALLAVVAQHRIGLVIPTIDTELAVLARLSDPLMDAGAHVLVSAPETVAIAADKLATDRHLHEHGLPAPQTWSGASALEDASTLPYPVIAKPRRGSSSVGFRRIPDAAQLRATVSPDDVVQERVDGPEFTVDVWLDGGTSVCAVPRRRIEVRAGEVSKGVTVADPEVAALAARVAESLPGADGPLTVQVIRSHAGPVVIEVNARLGGGYPLAVEAGAPTVRWGIQRALGLPRSPDRFDWHADVLMLRHDRSVFVHGWDGHE